MTTRKRPETAQPEAPRAISGHADDWIRQFLKHLELHFLEASHNLPPDASLSALQATTARAILATFLDSGMGLQSALELLGQAALQAQPRNRAWSDALNERRFALIDKEIQGTLTPAENIELAGLTRILRDYVESETNLPTEGARALHQKLLHGDAPAEAE